MNKHFNEIPSWSYVYNDSCPERKVDHLSVTKTYIAFFPQCNFDEVLIAYRNPVERVHSIVSLRLQSIGLIRKAMPENIEKITRNANSNGEIRKLREKNSKLETELKKSLVKRKKME